MSTPSSQPPRDLTGPHPKTATGKFPKYKKERQDSQINAIALFVREITFPRNLSDCWVWMGDGIPAAQRRAWRLYRGDDQDREIVMEPDCHYRCVHWIHMSLKETPR